MPLDQQWGEKIAEVLTAANTGRIQGVTWDYDTVRYMDRVTETPEVIITPQNMTYVDDAHGRGVWHRNVSLSMIMFVRQEVSTPEKDWIGNMLDAWDNLCGLAMDLPVVDEVNSDQRYNIEQFQTNSRLICSVELVLDVLREPFDGN